jgi:Cu/Ag efflux protein CusF
MRLAALLLSLVFVGSDAHYSTRGVVKSFGPKRAYVSIAHEKIPGYMEAMTMSFEPRAPSQLDGIDVGAHVAFAFTDTGDGHRLLDRIAKE